MLTHNLLEWEYVMRLIWINLITTEAIATEAWNNG